jgi:hypothetical protein
LQGKALYTSLDLRYAYLGLRIDEESRKLTTFLTPTGSFQWLALPTGSANAPAYFTDACNRILHYAPEYDSEGNLLYEAKNVVKLKRDVLGYVCNYFDDILVPHSGSGVAPMSSLSGVELLGFWEFGVDELIG